MPYSEDRAADARSAARQRKGIAQWRRKKQLEAVRVPSKRKDRPRRPRQKNIPIVDVEDWDEIDTSSADRVMPRGERDRRRAVAQAAFIRPESSEALPDARPGGCGIVMEVSAGACRVHLGARIFRCRMQGSLSAPDQGFSNPVAVGDHVRLIEDGADVGTIQEILPRRSFLARPDVSHRHLRQIVVANVDQVLVVSSWRDPAIWMELIDRYLVTAVRSGLAAAICVNKVDLSGDRAACEAGVGFYRALGYPVLFTSARERIGIDDLSELLRDRTTVLAGLSGVGKSSLLAAIQPGLQLRTGEVSTRGEGRHTTTASTLLQLNGGGAVVDTPGIREFGLAGMYQQELAACFAEFAPLVESCQFNDCLHVHETGCAVRAAVDAGAIVPSRYQSYSRICSTLPAR